jgi:hypothetical protein
LETRKVFPDGVFCMLSADGTVKQTSTPKPAVSVALGRVTGNYMLKPVNDEQASLAMASEPRYMPLPQVFVETS